jgi:hypothetical protein
MAAQRADYLGCAVATSENDADYFANSLTIKARFLRVVLKRSPLLQRAVCF